MKLLFVNGSRGEWGYIRPIIKQCYYQNIGYSICATNMLLLPEYGALVDKIKKDGYNVSDEIYMSLEGSNHFSMAKSLSIFMSSFVDVLTRHKPDWILLAGDRGEQLIGALVGAYTYTPVAHIQAGERSGNIDGIARHSLGKFAHIHFAANQDAADRLIGLGEQSFRVHNVGAPQLDELNDGYFANRTNLAERYRIDEHESYLLVLQHPVTEEIALAKDQVKNLIEALNYFPMKKIWILPNNDAGSLIIRREILRNRNRDIQVFENLPRIDFLGLLKYSQAIVGNSSSGLIEAPTFNTPAVNIGRRQEDRVQGYNVVNSSFQIEECIKSIEKAISSEFRSLIRNCSNPYGDGHSASRIVSILSKTQIDEKLLTKRLTY